MPCGIGDAGIVGTATGIATARGAHMNGASTHGMIAAGVMTITGIVAGAGMIIAIAAGAGTITWIAAGTTAAATCAGADGELVEFVRGDL